MNKQHLHIVLVTIGLVFIAGYMTWSIFILPDNRDTMLCNDVRVYVSDSTSRQFIRTNEIVAMLKQNKLYPKGTMQKELDAGAIEQLIGSHNLIKSAQCYATPNGDVIVRLKQKEPKFRVIGVNGDYFVDTERSLM